MKEKREVSRRKFLQTAASAGVVAGMATVAMPIAANADTQATAGPAEGRARPEDPLEKILSRYGSELGQVNRTS
jgi:nitrous oxide reductase